MTETIDCAVIGAGVIGLAIARALAQGGREVVVLEEAGAIGTVTSSRHSEVIHSGIYYDPGSLKARLCREGRDRLYAYAEEHGIAHRRYGKLIVASRVSEIPAINELRHRAEANGVDDLEWLDGPAVHALEPALNAVEALLLPSSGVIDCHGLMLSLQGEAEVAGAVVALLSPVLGGRLEDERIRLRVGGRDAVEVVCRTVVNCAGLGAQAVARALVGLAPETIPRRYLAKGNYFALSGKAPFQHLIYPVPENAGFGIHLTLDLAGQARFGPDVEWVEAEDYDVDPARADAFYTAVRAYWPELKDGSLSPAYAGIRPKLQAPGGAAADFVIQGPQHHGIEGLVNLYGMESPGMTASLAIAEAVRRLIA